MKKSRNYSSGKLAAPGGTMSQTVPVPAGFVDPTTPPDQLALPSFDPAPGAPVRTRPLALLEEEAMPPAPEIPVAALLAVFYRYGRDQLDGRHPERDDEGRVPELVGDAEGARLTRSAEPVTD